MINHIVTSLEEAKSSLNNLLNDHAILAKIESAGKVLINTFESQHRIFSCGNGGSMCDAMHFAEELTGRYRDNRRPYPAIAISDPSHISCVANDFGYDVVFSRYLQAHANKGDSLIAISTSGSSPTIINAVKTAQSLGINSIVLSGNHNPALEQLTDIYICTPAGSYADRVQELHIKVLYILIELIERFFHPENYDTAK